MRRLALLLALPLVLAACGKKDDPPATPTATSGTGSSSSSSTTPSGSASDVLDARAKAGTVNGRCPVQPDLLVEADAEVVEYDDPVLKKKIKVGFCCDKCPKKFRDEPEKYMPKMRSDPVRFGYAP